MDKPRMTDVKSGNVAAIGHHAERNELHVAFKGGGHYVYENCCPEHHDAMLAASSPGTYHAQNIKSRFPFTKAG